MTDEAFFDTRFAAELIKLIRETYNPGGRKIAGVHIVDIERPYKDGLYWELQLSDSTIMELTLEESMRRWPDKHSTHEP